MKTPPLVVEGWGISKQGTESQYHKNNWTKYKLDAAHFEALWNMQEGCCAICKITMAHPTRRDANKQGVKCYVDHKHKELVERLGSILYDQVRGLLCLNCNSLLGELHEDLNFLRGAQHYLEKYGTSVIRHTTPEHGKVKEKRFDEIEIVNPDGTKETYKHYYE